MKIVKYRILNVMLLLLGMIFIQTTDVYANTEYPYLLDGNVVSLSSYSHPSGNGASTGIKCNAVSDDYDFVCVSSVTASSGINYNVGTLQNRVYYGASLSLISKSGVTIASNSSGGGTTALTITIPASTQRDLLKGAHLVYTQTADINADNWEYVFNGFSFVASGGPAQISSSNLM